MRRTRIEQRHRPPELPRRRAEGKEGASTEIQQRARHSRPGQQAHRFLGGVAFGDSAQIHLHARPPKTHRAADRVQFQPVAADPFPKPFFRRGDVERAAEETPGAHGGTDGDVECPVVFAPVVRRQLQQLEHLLGDRNGRFRGVAVEAGQFRIAIAGETVFQPPQLREGRRGVPRGGGFLGGVHFQRRHRAHDVDRAEKERFERHRLG